MVTTPWIVSACLAGEPCRYDGKANTVPAIVALVQQGLAVPVCPELLGGLAAPRTPCEIKGKQVWGQDGLEYTTQFTKGAEEGLCLARQHGCKGAILKARSPSCGCGHIYDGTFTHTRIPGNGIFAQLLLDAGFHVYTEENASLLSAPRKEYS